MADELPPDMTAEEVQGVIAPEPPQPELQGRAPQSVDEEKPPDMTPEQVQGPKPPDMTPDQAAEASLNRNLSGRSAEELKLPAGPVSVSSAANTLAARHEFMDQDHGWLENAFYTMTQPEQFMARQAVNLLENVGAMSTEEARDFLARDQVHGSDVVNFYWRDPSNPVETAARFVTGLAADILIDPLTYVGIGALTQAGKEARILGKTISLAQASRRQRQSAKAFQAVEKLITSEGSVSHIAEGAEAVFQQNKVALARARDEMLGFDQLDTALNISPEVRKEMISVAQPHLTAKSWAKEWAEGTRGFTVGFRVPFTNLGMESDVPGAINKLASLPFSAVDQVFGLTGAAARSIPGVEAGISIINQMATQTGKVLFDAQQVMRFGSKIKLDEQMAKYEKAAMNILEETRQSHGDERFGHMMKEFREELELPVLDENDLQWAIETFEPSPAQLNELMQRNSKNAVRATQRTLPPEMMDLAAKGREQMKSLANEMKARGMPFEELNPFRNANSAGELAGGPDPATGYLKHVINEQWFRKLGQAEDGSKLMSEALGVADQSAKGRGARGTIDYYNAQSMERDGVKMFVDNPAELLSTRTKEMKRLIDDHDLMKSSLYYASEVPGPGLVKFEVDHFRKLSIDQSDQFAAKWDAFIPKEFKSGNPIYLPEDIYNRMEFAINGWQHGPTASKFLNAAQVYTNIFRNYALFGASYQGLNFFSNMMTYTTMNDRGLPGLVKAAALLTPDTILGKGIDALSGAATGLKKGISVNVKIGEEFVPHTLDQIREMAVDHNVLGSSFTAPMKFSDFAEHVASNRDARKNLGQKISDVADVAYLWRYNRGFSQFADEIPKLGVFISRLEAGFTPEAAANFAEQYYYSFNNMSKGMNAVASTIPFSSFPMKTAEMVSQQLKSGHLAGMTIPGKVQAALDGAFVQDHESRIALDQMLPSYINAINPIHGALMPGMREVSMDVPWAHATMDMFLSPERMNHPLAQLIGLAGWALTGLSGDEQDLEQVEEGRKNAQLIAGQNVDMIIPSYMREALTLAEINGVFNFGGFFKNRYAPAFPTNTQYERALSGRDLIDSSPIVHKFENAAQFGEAMDKQYGNNWLYNMVFHNRIEDDTVPAKEEAAIRGEYVRRRMRQFSLGLATVNKLDTNFFANIYAIKRQHQKKLSQLKSDLAKTGALMDTERINEPEFLAKIAGDQPLAKEVLSLQFKKEALAEYYNFFLEADAKEPRIDLISVLTGANEYDFDFKPETETFNLLNRPKTMRSLDPEDVNAYTQDIVNEEAP